MKRLFFVTLLAFTSIISACQEESETAPKDLLQKSDINLKELSRACTDTKLFVTLESKNGDLVSLENLKSNTEYIIAVKADQGSELLIRNQEGFEVLSNSKKGNQTNYLIKTNATILEKLYISITPIVDEGGQLKKQNVSNFLLPI